MCNFTCLNIFFLRFKTKKFFFFNINFIYNSIRIKIKERKQKKINCQNYHIISVLIPRKMFHPSFPMLLQALKLQLPSFNHFLLEFGCSIHTFSNPSHIYYVIYFVVSARQFHESVSGKQMDKPRRFLSFPERAFPRSLTRFGTFALLPRLAASTPFHIASTAIVLLPQPTYSPPRRHSRVALHITFFVYVYISTRI